MILGIFIEPNYLLKKYIINWKKKFGKLNHKFKYVKHPPHLTILTINLENRKYEIQKIINNIKILKLEKFIIQASSKKIFFNDIITGGDTIVIDVKKNKNLLNMQKNIADKLIFLNKPSHKEKYFSNIHNLNYKKYGYPYIGKIWSPHFTICSLNKNFKNKELVNDFMNEKILFNFKLNKISIWEIKKDDHKKIKDIYFK